MKAFIKQYRALVTGGGISLILLLGAGAFLFIQIRQYLADTGEADENQNRLTQLEQRQPGPTAANVQIVASNAVAVEGSLKKLLLELRRGQVEPVNKPRSVFNSFLKSNIDQMNKAAEKQGVLVPAKFDYGFKAYVEGQLPATQDVARLTVQVQLVRALMDLLLECKTAEIVAIERQVFEDVLATPATAGEPVGRGGEGGRGEGGRGTSTTPTASLYPLEPPDAQGLYTREHVTLTLRMTDEHLALLMNILARNVVVDAQQLFVVVSRVNIIGVGLPGMGSEESRVPGGRGGEAPPGVSAPPAAVPAPPEAAPPADGSAPLEKPALPKKRGERIVAGMDNVTVQLDVDIYRFAEAVAKEKGKP
jgi:hypothetical protein